MGLRVLGVRHHSPACARLVERAIAEARPRYVLIEGPSDINDRIGELSLGHILPIAVFSYSIGPAGPSSSWSPLCDYSPEWVALRAAERAGAQAFFIDLPAWHEAFTGVKNRYADRRARASEGIAALCDKLGLPDVDALWDHLFEQPMPLEELDARLAAYFRELRAAEQEGAEESAREAFMARWIAWAMADCEARGGDVVVVCGGYHAPALERLWRGVPAELAARRPEAEERAPIDSREGAASSEARRSYLVPYSFYRLDSFVGYESGMPSPAYYQAVWDEGAEAAGESMMFAAIDRLRKKKQLVSAADAIAASTCAQALRSLRGHRALARADVLDGLAGALVKDSLDAPLPWTRRGRLLPRTDPMLVEIVAAFSGDRTGELAPETPRPPLVLDAIAQIEAAGIPFTAAAATLHVPITEPDGLVQSRVLHRLRVLAVPGITRTRAPSWGRSGASLVEVWSVKRALDADAALIEASAYGATLEAAAAARIEELLLHARDVGLIAGLLFEAALIGARGLAARMLADIERAVWSEPSFPAIGKALAHLIALFRHDVILGMRGSQELAAVIGASFDRGLWLFEGIQGANAPLPQADVSAAVALRDTLIAVEDARAERGGGQGSGPPGVDPLAPVDRARAQAVMRRRARDADAPAALRGAALGFLWSTGFFDGAPASMGDPGLRPVDPNPPFIEPEEEPAEAEAVAVLRASARPDSLGDFLLGLFALAREEVQRARSLLRATDAVIGEMPERDFLVAVPSLRLAYSYLPPSERARVASLVLALHAAPGARATQLLKLEIAPDTILRGRRLDMDLAELERRYGLAGEEGA